MSNQVAESEPRKIGDPKDFFFSESRKGQPSQPTAHPRLRIQIDRDSKTENIFLDQSSTVSHITVSSSSEESELEKLVTASYPGLCGSYVFYLSVGQMKHFKIEMKPQVELLNILFFRKKRACKSHSLIACAGSGKSAKPNKRRDIRRG
jgi:hypothetical protein